MTKELDIPIIETNASEAENNIICGDVKILVKGFYYKDEISDSFHVRKMQRHLK